MRVLERAGLRSRVLVGFLAICVALGLLTTRNQLVALALVSVAIVALIVVSRPGLAGVVAMSVIPVGSGLRGASGSITPAQVLLVLLTILLAAVPRPPTPWDRLDQVVFLFAAAAVALGAYDMAAQHADGSLVTLLVPVQFFLLFRIARTTLVDDHLRRLALRGLLFASVPASTLAIAQGVKVPGTDALLVSLTNAPIFDTWEYRHHPRATGPFPIWHALAGYLLVVILVCVALLAVRSQKIMNPVGVGVIAGLGTTALVMSQTFTALIALLVGSCILMARLRAMRALTILAAIGLVVVVLFGSVLSDRLDQQYSTSSTGSGTVVPQTIGFRFTVWTDQYLPNLGQYVVTGYGPGVPPGIVWQHTESTYITLLLSGGLPLLVLHLWLMVSVYRAARRVERDTDGVDAAIALVVSTTVLLLWVMNLIWPYSSNSGLVQPFWLLAGMALVPLTTSRRTAEDRPETSLARP